MKTIYSYFLLALFLISCKTAAPPQDQIPAHETLNINSVILGETRNINIWTPTDYAKNPNSLPVLYMPDGGLKEDFPHIANTLAELIAAKKIPPTILVGIENTQRRRDLTGPTQVAKDKEIAPVVGGSANFREFIKTELIPAINQKYRTTSEKGIIGESLAGLFVTETLLLEPNLFDYYIAFDPSIWWNDSYIEKHAPDYLTKFPTTEKQFWFAGSADTSKESRAFAKAFEAANLLNLKWYFSDEPKENHGTIFRAKKEKALIWTMNKR
ncbi:alpha/beta hydrolase [Kaistella flava (ex Peng et al. 2021)]|uniref:Alpha/beta hydrolase n=1 Tax=Kaistella flava (ex Peng et al. 2021) TaxID=2038776 RepID=A0A7M2Y3S8_9FLAO|nr:alpha/beta hydrolase-fold protein [Kaistella flava (ex Peng et al. 2021)]QOW08877.1 alpha/beta hydrolase [Kaistella flava (ex Peng et al. 2021)]